MTGQTMSSCIDSDVVTVNASDLIDCVLHAPPSLAISTTTAASSYSPGFYSSSTPCSSSQVVSSITSSSTAVDTVSSSTSTLLSNPSSAGDLDSGSSAQAWSQNVQPHNQESQNQNVIKLIYESSDTGTSTSTTTPRMVAANTNPAPQSVAAPCPPLYTNSSFSSNSLSSDLCGKCFSCNKEELKKNMVT